MKERVGFKGFTVEGKDVSLITHPCVSLNLLPDFHSSSGHK